MQLPFTILPQTTILFQPPKRTLHDPTFGKHLKGMKFIPFHHFHFCMWKKGLYFLCKGFPHISSIYKKSFHRAKRIFLTFDHRNRTLSIRHRSLTDKKGMWKSQRIHYQMQFDSRNFFMVVISFFFCSVCIFDTFCIDYPKRRLVFFEKFIPKPSDPFFLRLDPEDFLPFHLVLTK